MQVVHFTDENTGSFDWELPKEVAAAVSSLQVEQQAMVINELQRQVHGYLLMLVGTTKMGNRVPLAFALIDDAQTTLLQQLQQLASI